MTSLQWLKIQVEILATVYPSSGRSKDTYAVTDATEDEIFVFQWKRRLNNKINADYNSLKMYFKNSAYPYHSKPLTYWVTYEVIDYPPLLQCLWASAVLTVLESEQKIFFVPDGWQQTAWITRTEKQTALYMLLFHSV